MEELVLYNIIYLLITFFLIYPPQEVQSAGLTLPVLFSSWLGSEQLCFVHYHIARISLTFVVHSFLPLGYYLFMSLNIPELGLFPPYQTGTSEFWRMFFMCSVLIPIGVGTMVYYWSDLITLLYFLLELKTRTSFNRSFKLNFVFKGLSMTIQAIQLQKN